MAASTILARSSSRNSLKSILPLPVLSMLTIIPLTCAWKDCAWFGQPCHYVRRAVLTSSFRGSKPSARNTTLSALESITPAARTCSSSVFSSVSWGGAVEHGRTLPFAVEEVERLSNLGALVLGEREQGGLLLGLGSHVLCCAQALSNATEVLRITS